MAGTLDPGLGHREGKSASEFTDIPGRRPVHPSHGFDLRGDGDEAVRAVCGRHGGGMVSRRHPSLTFYS